MATLTYKKAIELGSPNIHYVYNIGGLPWYVGTSKAVIDAIEDNFTYKRLLFGNKQLSDAADDPIYPVDVQTVGFPWLDFRHLGIQRWSLADDEGMLSGGDWSVLIADGHPGKDWQFNIGGQEFWGLPGLTAYARRDPTGKEAYGHCTTALDPDGNSVDVVWSCPQLNVSAINEAVAANGYCLMWLGHECIAVKANPSGTFPNQTLTIAQSAAQPSEVPGRGLLRTRKQTHYTSNFNGTDEVISSSPGPCIGRHCYLWGVLLDSDGAIIDYALEREGVISNAQTSDGGTRIRINSPLSTLREELQKLTSHTMLARYVLSRGSNTADTPNDDLSIVAPDDDVMKARADNSRWPYVQSPHLVIHERTDSTDIEYVHHGIWLCGPNETISFDTWEEVIDAINVELDNCWNAAGTTTANGSAGGQVGTGTGVWWNSYKVCDKGYLVKTGGTGNYGITSFAQGPLAIYGMLGKLQANGGEGAPQGNEELADFAAAICNNNPTYMQQSVDFSAANMWEWDKVNKSFKYSPMVQIGFPPVEIADTDLQEYSKPTWLYQWNWEDYPLPNKTELAGQNGESRKSQPIISVPYFSFCDDSKGGQIYFKKSADPSVYTSGLEFHLGSVATVNAGVTVFQNCLLIGESDGNGTTGGDSGDWPYIEITDYATDSYGSFTAQRDENLASALQFSAGKTLFYNPLAHAVNYGLFGEESNTLTPDITLGDNEAAGDLRTGFVIEQSVYDIWPLTLRNSEQLIADKLSDIIKGLMGYPSASLQVPDYRTLSWIPFFVDETPVIAKDFSSLIDYASMDTFFEKPFADAGSYRMDVKGDLDPYKAIANEILYHRAGMVYEYSVAQKRWIIRFRRIGPVNVSIANGEGRLIDVSSLAMGSGPPTNYHSDEPRYKNVVLKFGDNEFTISDATNKMLASKVANKSITIEPSISHLDITDSNAEVTTSEFYRLFGDGMLRYFVEPSFSQDSLLTIQGTYLAALGREALITNAAARDPYTHAQGVTNAAARITSVSRDLTRSSVSIKYELAASPVYGWAPAALVDSAGTIDGTNVNFDVSDFEAHEFSDSSIDRPDIYWFDCINWDVSAGSASSRSSCGCDQYKILAIKYDTNTPGTILKFDIAVNLTAQTVQFTERVAGHAALWDDTAQYVLIFDSWDVVEDCQKLFVYAADKANTLGTNNDSPRRWV